MNIIADTQILIWSLDVNSPLSKKHKEILQDTSNKITVSQVSLMELVIKKSIGKLPGFVPDISEVAATWIKNGYEILPLLNKQIFAYQNLPLFEEHRDPFDRFIIAAALAENMKIITTDSKFNLYKDYIEIL